MNKHHIKFIIIISIFISNFIPIHSQTTTGVTGLLHMPNAEMHNDGTVMIGGNFLNENNLPSDSWWGHDTYNYFIKLPGFNTLRVLLANKIILVEGPADELIIQSS